MATSSSNFKALEFIFLGWHIFRGWEIEYTDEFGSWWDELGTKEQVSVSASVDLLGLLGPGLGFPIAQKLYDVHLEALRKEGRNHG